MAKVDYDGFAGIGRMADAEATIDMRAAVVLTFHAALEREIDLVLAGLLPRSGILRSIGYQHKITVLSAAWRGDADAGDRLYTVLFRFNELRNAVAHGDRMDLVEGCLERLFDAYRAIDPKAEGPIEIGFMAQGICSFMADGPPITEFLEIAASMDRLVNETIPRAFGAMRQSDKDGVRR